MQLAYGQNTILVIRILLFVFGTMLVSPVPPTPTYVLLDRAVSLLGYDAV